MTSQKIKQPQKRSSKKQSGFWNRHRRLCKWLLGIFGTTLLLILAVYIAFQISPWPNALLIRQGFDKGSLKTSQALEKYTPNTVTQIENQQYRANDKDARIDVFYPDKTTVPLPTIVWVHGGAWVSGDKDDVDNYMKILASHGFTTVSVNYTIAPEKQYPTPITQLNDALGYLQRNAKRLNVDDSRFMLGGDSAGSQIVAQMANIITSQAYAKEIDIHPQLTADKLKGLLLNCGAYDLALPDYNGEFGKLLHTVLWAYSGDKDFLNDPKLKTASVVNYLTPAFPPSFITAGNVDPLLAQSTELAQKLEALRVPTSTLFYPANHRPELNHEYQFNLDTSDGQQALKQMVDFAKQHTQ
ncbi:MAG: lipase [Candidatus Saccharibacteria bacterium]|nr:lipase [Candidatus Saccharibacteria bacterium]